MKSIPFGPKIALLMLLFILVALQPTSATTYYFSTTGSDANSGLTTSVPKQSIDAAIALMTSGNTILFKRGDIWYIPGKTINLTGRSSVTIDAYGTGNKPIIAGMGLLNGTWTHMGSGVWRHTNTAFNFAHRVFVNGVSRINVLHKRGNTNTLSNLDSTDEFYNSGSDLYLKMVSTTVAPTNVEIVPGFPGVYAGFEVVKMKNTTNVTINNIEFRGGSVAQVIYVEAPCANLVFNNCTITRASRHGLIAINPLDNADVVENISVTNCIVDKGWTLEENNIVDSFHLDGAKWALFLTGDGIAFVHGVKTGLISGNLVKNFGHDGIVLSGYGGPNTYGVKFVKIEANEVLSGNSGYMHAFSLNGIPGKVMRNIIKRNYFHDFNAGCNITGEENFIFSNIFSNVTVTTVPQHSQSPWAANIGTWYITPSKGTIMRNNYISNNSFYRTSTHAIFMARNTADTMDISGNKFYNNIMSRFGRDTSFPLLDGQSAPPPTVAIRLIVSVSEGKNYFRNNNFWPNCDTDYCDTTNSKRIVLYGTTYYTIANFNGCGKCGAGNSIGNVQLNPRWDAFFGLTPYSSATLRTGGYNYKTNIVGWGLPAAEFVDYYGVPWPETNVSIGAIQYIP